MAFNIGSQVRLATGGPVMVVTHSDDENTTCEWFGKRELMERSFPTAALVAHEPIEAMTSTIIKR